MADALQGNGAALSAQDAVWQARYAATRAALDDPQQVLAMQHLVRQIDGAQPPLAQVLVGASALRSAQRVCLLAGSFNPLTLAHVALAQAARAVAALDLVVWTCAAVTVDKESVARATLADRLVQLAAHLRGQPAAALVLVNRGLYVDQARALRAELAPDADLAIVIGYDKLVQIFDPRYYADREAALQALFGVARLLVAPRGEDGAEAVAALLARPENRPYTRHVTYIPLAAEHATESSSAARALAANTPDASTRASVQRLLPPEGLALADATGAYQPATADAHDRYHWRTQWLRALQDAPARVLADIRSLAALTDATTDATVRGATLRAALTAADAPQHIATLLHLATQSA